MRRPRNPHLAFVEAINFELTYDCDLNCSHCLQQNMRPNWAGVRADPDLVKSAMKQARDMGLMRSGGVNFTGGEPMLLQEELFDLIRYARSLSIPVRLNSNTSWGRDGNSFDSPEEIVRYLKECGLTMFAFSFDERFESTGETFEHLAGAVGACETEGVLYQIVFTGVDDRQTLLFTEWLEKELSRTLSFMIPVSMSMVDIGGAANGDVNRIPDGKSLAALARSSDCQGSGFYRPHFIHVDPAGGVRTCLYAPGLANLGNLHNETLTSILDRFPNDRVSEAFRSGSLEDRVTTLFIPELWEPFSHACTAAVVATRLIESMEIRNGNSGVLKLSEIENLNLQISDEMGLSVEW